MRALGIDTETIIGQTIDVQDMPGNSGATGLECVLLIGDQTTAVVLI